MEHNRFEWAGGAEGGKMYRDKINFYIDHINRDVLTKIRYMQLQRDYQTEEKVYVKSILNALHKYALEVYGEDSFGKDGGNRGTILLPGVLQARGSKNLCIVLLEMNGQPHSELTEISYLTQYGCISTDDTVMPETVRQFLEEMYGEGGYDYATSFEEYDTASEQNSPEEIRKVLEDFKNYTFLPCDPEEALNDICDYIEDEEIEQ